jgi:MYM-type Zinc finger with FCS sequence motif
VRLVHRMSGRGRGKRAALKTTITTSVDALNTEPAVEVKKGNKKKQFPIVAVVTPDGIEGSLLSGIKRPLIVHLPIQSKEVSLNDMPIMYDPLPPTEAQPYDRNADDPFCDEVEYVPASVEVIEKPVEKKETVTVTKNVEQEIDYYTLKSTLLVQYMDASDKKQIPMKTDAACFWCCHPFTHRPVVLPIRDTGEYLTVMGNFCSPECAASYLFDMRQDSHTRWEQLSLLYRVYGEACQGKIHPAPPRSSLQLFGGSLTIQQYRQLIQSQQVRVDIHLPPMVSILSTMDTKPIDFYDASLTKNVNETVKERLQKVEDVLRLRRTKPLKAWESTLDACLNLKIRSDPAS